MKFIKFNNAFLEQFFEENFIEDDDLYNFLKDREGIIEHDTKTKIDNQDPKEGYMILNIKIKLTDN
jgi:hypothetical protein